MNRLTPKLHERLDLGRLGPPAGSRIAIVGGCGGIGRPLVAACVENGLDVTVLDLPASLARHSPPDGVASLPLDAVNASSVNAAFELLGQRWDRLDVLVFLVGFTITPPVALTEVRPEQWDEVMAGNLRSAWLVARAAVPLMRQAGGVIVNVASTLGLHVLPGFGPYAAAKAGLIALTKSLAVECGPAIRANAVAPSAMHTAFMGGGTGRGGDDGGHEWFHQMPSSSGGGAPLGRIAVPEDVLGPILFFASPAARFITGQTLLVNGGRHMP